MAGPGHTSATRGNGSGAPGWGGAGLLAAAGDHGGLSDKTAGLYEIHLLSGRPGANACGQRWPQAGCGNTVDVVYADHFPGYRTAPTCPIPLARAGENGAPQVLSRRMFELRDASAQRVRRRLGRAVLHGVSSSRRGVGDRQGGGDPPPAPSAGRNRRLKTSIRAADTKPESTHERDRHQLVPAAS